MSTDLHLHHELPKLRISAVKMEDIHSSDRNMSNVVPQVKDENDAAVSADDDESYRTPTSKESKIPAILTCPPAPRKSKAFVSCKRKLLDEFQFFEVTNKEDMDAFFRSTFPKRSCPCT
ncbi:cyclin-dependent protein kinase inhibitor SMR6-like [Gastrolobium bilobum]|uniref:cyclin-dependent protein kinase inhibitor SMR6-like n=1 Tax=Gastrolobium bilobum TaxID=150636 RepID=UPI002AAFEAE2|nr:cyclin-dependent protein kinase inhibitor SMR6-like [Gastrolobium bilobum]